MSALARRRLNKVVLSALAVVVFLWCVFPVYWMVNTSLLPNNETRGSTPHFFPDLFTWRNYQTVLDSADRAQFLPALKNSLLVTGFTVVIAILFAFVAALAVARFAFLGRKALIFLILIIQMIPAEAMIDGCTRAGAFRRITFPLMAPGLVATGVFGFIQAWNEFLLALVVNSRPEMMTLPVWLRTFQTQTEATNWAAIMAGSTLMTIPVVLFFIIVQGRMTSGLVAGAVKG
jgi:N,N'-diacetylchitobiose transport system permease protein